jgi:cell wall-associated NlpC family hydrolase
MGALGIVMVVSGVWFAYSGYKNLAPLGTLKTILQDPGHARQIVADRTLVLDPGAGSGGTATTSSSSATATGTPTQNLTGGAAIVGFAKSQIGKPYIFGGTGNPGWDCSGLAQAALATAGVTVSHHATAQYFSSQGKFVRNPDGSKPSLKNVSSLKPGDLIFPYAPTGGDVGHVGIYSGNGNFIEAAKPGTNVREIPMYSLYDAKRFV